MPKRVILISVDDLRYDALSCESDTRYLDRYGIAGVRATPTLDGLAARGTRFGQAIAAASYTPASHATMLTGRFPPGHGVRAFMTRGLDSKVPTLAATLLANGFHTVSAIDFSAMFALLGLDRGFEQRFAADDTALLEHLGTCVDEPLFCFVHLVDVHPPVGESFCPPWDGYNDDFYAEVEAIADDLGVAGAPAKAGDGADGRARGIEAEELRRATVAASGRIRTWAEDRAVADAIELPRYLAGVNKFDRGRLRWLLERLAAVGVLEDALLVVTSDHGQATIWGRRMGDPRIPQKFDHGESVVEEAIRVPLILSGPRIPEGKTIDQQVSLADLTPTLLDWAGLDPQDEQIDGRSLLGLLDGADHRDSRAYAEVWFHDRAALSRHLRRSLAAGGLLADGYDTFLNERIVRTPRHKYSRRGSELTDADHAASDVEFVRACHEKLLSRVPDRALADEHVRQLRDGARTRDQLAADLAARNPDREALYDLRADPREEVNLLVLARSLAWIGRSHPAVVVAGELAAVMDEIDGRDGGCTTGACAMGAGAGGRAPAPGDLADEGLARVEARLRDLGYID
jgi:arylsulfatase A-like enzyme